MLVCSVLLRCLVSCYALQRCVVEYFATTFSTNGDSGTRTLLRLMALLHSISTRVPPFSRPSPRSCAPATTFRFPSVNLRLSLTFLSFTHNTHTHTHTHTHSLSLSFFLSLCIKQSVCLAFQIYISIDRSICRSSASIKPSYRSLIEAMFAPPTVHLYRHRPSCCSCRACPHRAGPTRR